MKYRYNKIYNVLILIAFIMLVIVFTAIAHFMDRGTNFTNKIFFGNIGIALVLYINDFNKKKNRYIAFFDDHICFNSVDLFISKRYKTGSFNVLYEDIKHIRAVYVPFLRYYRVYIKADNVVGEILLTRYYKDYLEMYSKLCSLTKAENPDVIIDEHLLKFLTGE